jgi:excisionase family DNA binding protein
MLTTQDVAAHVALRPDTIRRHIRDGRLRAARFQRDYRVDWPDLWACEDGPLPQGADCDRYKAPLLKSQDIARRLGVSARTVERWRAQGLPTRNVFGNVRFNPRDVEDWLHGRFGIHVDLGAAAPGAGSRPSGHRGS